MSRSATLLHASARPTAGGAEILDISSRVCALLLVFSISLGPATARAEAAARAACVEAHVRGQELRLEGKYAEARARFTTCASRSCPDLISKDCATLLAELDKELPTVVFAVSDASGRALDDARVLVDGRIVSKRTGGRAVPVPPGTHTLRIERAGNAPHEARLEVSPADRGRVVRVRLADAARVETSAPAEPSLVPVYVVGGAGISVLATAVTLGVRGLRKLDRLDASCGRTASCTSEQAQPGKRLYIAADVGYAVGGALAVAAVSLYLARHLRRGERAPVALELDGTRALLRYDGRF